MKFNVKRASLLRLLFEESLDELFTSEAFKESFKISLDQDKDYRTEKFKDLQGNTIEIIFWRNIKDSFLLDFTINGDSYRSAGTRYTVREYSEVLATVAKAVSQFLREIKPFAIDIVGEDYLGDIFRNPKKEGQKGRLYAYFLSQIDSNSEYSIGKIPDGFRIQSQTYTKKL